MIDSAIGKAKRWLKDSNRVVPVSAYNIFKALANAGEIEQEVLADWNAIIGLRNRIMYEYMNIEFDQIIVLVREERERFIVDFLLMKYPKMRIKS
jgi:uncharacterized protein YutE (UPF0331/DUF86 family)